MLLDLQASERSTTAFFSRRSRCSRRRGLAMVEKSLFKRAN